MSDFGRAADLTEPTSPDFADYCHNLAIGLRARFGTRRPRDLERAIAAATRPRPSLAHLTKLAGDPDRAGNCSVIDSSKHVWGDLEGSISLYERALAVIPVNSPDRPGSLAATWAWPSAPRSSPETRPIGKGGPRASRGLSDRTEAESRDSA